MGKYDLLKDESIMLIGERYPTKISWLQLYDSSDSIEEEEMRHILIEISQHISKGRISSGSARKFLDGKLIFFEYGRIAGKVDSNKIYCIFTEETDIKIASDIKTAMESIALRGGIYSAKRFFSEIIDLLENPDELKSYKELTIEQALKKIDTFNITLENLNELGHLISHIHHSTELDQITLEKIYFNIYESIQMVVEGEIEGDIDEFLDAAYLVALKYQETNNFHLALELFKQIISITESNERYDLQTACRIQISSIYKQYFPTAGQYILEILEPVEEKHLKETNNKNIEIYYCLLGHAYYEQQDLDLAVKSFKQAIKETQNEINAPIWISEAYNFLGQIKEENQYLKEASRYYLTAATIAFSAGDITLADKFRHNASNAEIQISNSIMHTALIHRMDKNLKDAEYRAWESLRLLIKSYMHSYSDKFSHLEDMTSDILYYAEKILAIPGKIRKNQSTLRKIDKYLEELQTKTVYPEDEQENLQELARAIEENIPLAPPTFMLISIDGRLMSMGKITDHGWNKPDIEGTLLSGVLSAIMSLITEVAEDTTSLRTVDAGNVQIMIEQSENVVIALLVDRDIQEFRTRLVSLLHYIDVNMGEKLKFWDGNMAMFETIKKEAQKMLAPSIIASNLDNYN